MNEAWSNLKSDWDALVRRVDESGEIGYKATKGLTWDLLIHGKSPLQVQQEIKAMAEEFERQNRQYRSRRA
jgi:hypothetical protein